MPIHKPSVPQFVTDALFDGLPAFLSGPNYGSAGNVVKQGPGGHDPKIPSADDLKFDVSGKTSTPYEAIHVFALGVGDIMKGLGVSAATSIGWRCFVGDPGSRIAMASMSQRPPGAWKMAAAHYGPGVAAVLKASNELNSIVPGNAGYELHMLSVPSMNLEAFFLKAADGTSHIMVPFPNMSQQILPGLNTKPSYTEAEFLAAIRSDLKRRKSTVTVPKSGG